jgi:isopenicillin-N epimerase
LTGLRQQFLLDPAIAYLNHGGFGALPIAVFEARQRLLLQSEANPTAYHSDHLPAALDEALRQLAPHVGADSSDLAWTANATAGLNLVARSVMERIGPGDEVLVSDVEYGTQKMLWEWVCRQRGASFGVIETCGIAPADLPAVVESALTPATRLVLLSHISSSTALRLPVEHVAPRLRERGVTFVVDGAHAPGQITLDLSAIDCDYYVGNLHKWFVAPRGAAFIYAKAAAQALLDPLVVSWGGTDGSQPLAARVNVPGTVDASNWLAVPEAIAFHRTQLVPQRGAARDLLASTAEALACLGYERVGRQEDDLMMSSFWIPDNTDARHLGRLFVGDKIEAIITDQAERPILRVAVAWYTTDDETGRLLDACAGAAA